MRKGAVVLIFVGAAIVIAAFVLKQSPATRHTAVEHRPPAPQSVARQQPAQPAAPVPKHYDTAPRASSLGPTLEPAKFIGKTKLAYEVARKIPTTLAQLPCYCHCDQSAGHKSLHSCFEDEHAASCAICVDEALLAYELEKSGRTATQIREQIIAQYAAATH